MEPKIGTLTIERFRAFRHLKIEGLGRVNLITGRNNTGKSSVLEALRILASDGSPSVIQDILHLREEDAGRTNKSALSLDVEGPFPTSSLFHGCPEFPAKTDSIEIASNGGHRPLSFSLEAGWFSRKKGPDGSERLVPFSGEGEPVPALVTNVDGKQYVQPLETLRRFGLQDRPIRPDVASEPRLPCRFVSPYGGQGTAMLGTLWDNIALSDREKDVVDTLNIIDPGIVAVSMVGGEGRRQSRTAIVRSTGLPRPVPLRSFGDGMNRLFGIILSLVNATDGLLLIDEFENGMHHTVQADAWRAVFRLASRLDIQVVATSHSWDAIEAFQKAASESPEDGVLIRLTRKGDDIIPTVFREDELAIATRDRIEVR
jgi:hypothetical protein